MRATCALQQEPIFYMATTYVLCETRGFVSGMSTPKYV